MQASLVNKLNVFSICKSNLFFHKQGFSNNILADDAATYPIQQLLFQETKCVVFTFDTKSKECILYEDVTGGDVKADEDYIIGFCPKPQENFTVGYLNLNHTINIPANIEPKWWCYEENGQEKLCNFPSFRYDDTERKFAEIFEPFVGTEDTTKCVGHKNSVDNVHSASLCRDQSMTARLIN